MFGSWRRGDKGQEETDKKAPPAPLHEDVSAHFSDEEKRKRAQYGTYFRSHSFSSDETALPDEEYIEAQYVPSRGEWMIQTVSLVEAPASTLGIRTLDGSAIGGKKIAADDGADVFTEVDRVRAYKPLRRFVTFIEALQIVGQYEKDRIGESAGGEGVAPVKVHELDRLQHFKGFAHREGIIFDTDSIPSLTVDGRPAAAGSRKFDPADIEEVMRWHNVRNPPLAPFGATTKKLSDMWLSKETANLPVDQIAAYHSLSSRLNFVVTGLRTAYGSWRYYQSGFGSYDAGGHRVLGWDDRSDRYNNFSEAMTQVLLVLNQAVKNASGESADVLNDALLSVQTLYVIWLANTSREEKLDQVSGDRYAARKKDGLSKSFDLFATELQKLEAIATEKFGSDELNKLKIEVFRKRSSEAYAATLEKVIIQIGQIRTSLDKYVEQQIAAAETPKSLAHVAQALPRPGGSGGGAG